MLADSLFTAQGKVGSRLKLILAGTLAPMATGAGHWWWDLLAEGTKGRTHVQVFQGDAETWDQWSTIRKANPLIGLDSHTRKVILEERDAARGDGRLKARFWSYRLNRPSGDESTMLLTVDDWRRVVEREAPPRKGKPVVGVDLGAGRAWSAAVAIWKNGRTEALALAPGIPTIAEQERRDRVRHGAYESLVSAGLLHIADGLRVQPPSMLASLITETWGPPAGVVADRFRINDLADAGLPSLEPRMTRWSESSADIRGLRKMAKDGPLSVDPGSAPLLEESLAVSMVRNDDAGNVRLQKRGSNNQSRDDVAAALALAAGAHQRRSKAPKGGVYRGKSG